MMILLGEIRPALSRIHPTHFCLAARGDNNKVNADAWNREGRGSLDLCSGKSEWGVEKSD